MEIRKILIADPSPGFCQVLSDLLGSSFQLLSCQDGAAALELLDRFHPDVLVVDLTLPGLDGLTLLRSAMAMVPRPSCLATTRFLSHYIETAIGELGVDYVMMKPCDMQALADRILDLTSQDAPPPTCDTSIANTLIGLDVSSNRQGFPCLEAAIALYIQTPGISMTKELYPQVARDLDRSASSVERSIRSCVHNAWDHRNEKVWRLYFRADRNGNVPRPTNARFIANVAEHLRKIQQKE